MAQHQADVRMKGFDSLAPVQLAVQWVDEAVKTLPPEAVPLAEAGGRVLASTLQSPVDVPRFRKAMMDGYALGSDELHGATAENPKTFPVVGQSMPGTVFRGRLARGEAVRIMTGAKVPDEADVVVPVEKVQAQGEQVTIGISLPAGKHVAEVGEDIQQGTQVLPAGRRLRPQDVAVLSNLGMEKVSVVRKPSVRIVISGNELWPAGSRPTQDDATIDANGPMLQALVQRDGGKLTSFQMVPDEHEAIAQAILAPAEIVLISGGSSVGAEDFAPQVLAKQGHLRFHGLSMRPARPAGMGTIDGALVFLLPGNPVSCLCAYDFFAARAIRQLGGLPAGWPYPTQEAVLSNDYESKPDRLDYLRVRLKNGYAEIIPGGASNLSTTTLADGFVIVPAETIRLEAGSSVQVFRYDAGTSWPVL